MALSESSKNVRKVMIKELVGNLFDFSEGDHEKTKVIIHCCNDIGAWGSGFVVAINENLGLEPMIVYENAPKELGSVSYWHNPDAGLCVCNIIGQHGVRSSYNPKTIDYDAIRRGCKRVFFSNTVKFGKEWEIHMPLMGAGLAGGDWDKIAAIVDDEIASKGIDVFVYRLA
jgi:O-acetyl-ADP-ribose deacetylase (regulator of RNase III)